jgi:hypothetical protein
MLQFEQLCGRQLTRDGSPLVFATDTLVLPTMTSFPWAFEMLEGSFSAVARCWAASDTLNLKLMTHN